MSVTSRKLLISHRFALGDTVCLGGVLRDLQASYPQQYEVLLETSYSPLFDTCTYARPIGLTDFKIKPYPTRVELRLGDGIHVAATGEHVHMVSWYHRQLSLLLGIDIPCLKPHGEFHIPDRFMDHPIVEGHYWVFLSGGKNDMTTKHWWPASWQQTVALLQERNIACVQTGSTASKHFHPPIAGALNTVGKYNELFQLFNLIKYSQGVICAITGAMHIAAVLKKPCVVIAGGREDVWWEHYTNEYKAFGARCEPVAVPHRFLHTMGQLDCCQTKGCWRARTVPLELRDLQPTTKPSRLCQRPIRQGRQAVPACLDMITPTAVVDAVMSYYDQGTLIQPASYQLPILKGMMQDKMQTDKQQQLPREILARPVVSTDKYDSLDCPEIGGKFTVFVLLYGPFTDLAQRCLGSLMACLPPERMDLRIGCNQVSDETFKWLQNVPATKLYVDNEQRRKYPAMREMFYDTDCPIQTPYLIWLDDDVSAVNNNNDWPILLAQAIRKNHKHRVAMYGHPYLHDLSRYQRNGHDPTKWFKDAVWYRGQHFKDQAQGRETVDGRILSFSAGWFWAARTEAVYTANIPDVRLNHNGGDICIGEQIHQAGYLIHEFNRNKQYLTCPAKNDGGRRGYQDAHFPWSDQAAGKP